MINYGILGHHMAPYFQTNSPGQPGQPQSLLAAACCDHAEIDTNPVSSYEQYKSKTY